MNIRNTLSASLLALVAGVSFQASAADVSSSFGSTASVPSSCVLRDMNAINFNDYDAVFRHATRARTGSTIANVVCNGGSTATVQLDEGLNKMPGSTCAAPLRAMSDGAGNKLVYRLADGTGDSEPQYGCDATNSVKLTFTQYASKSVSITGIIPPAQDAPVGNYSDTITVKVLF